MREIAVWGELSLNDIANDYSRWEYQNIALAAVTQCASLVHTLAVTGRAPQTELLACVNPLLVLTPTSTQEVYPNVSSLSLGLRTVQDIFSNDRLRENADVVRYTLGMLLLRNKLNSNQALQKNIRQALQLLEPLQMVADAATENDATTQAGLDVEFTQEHTLQQLADLYQDTISRLPYRIQVQGKMDNLKNPQVTNKIRALLLAGIRSAVLWYQLGGRRWRLVIYRKRIQETAGNIRRKLIVSV